MYNNTKFLLFFYDDVLAMNVYYVHEHLGLQIKGKSRPPPSPHHQVFSLVARIYEINV